LIFDFQKHIQNNFSFLKGKKLLIAISGGLDSVVLTHLFNEMKFEISLAHCNFNLRGNESYLDEEFVKNMATVLKKEYFITHFDTAEYAIKIGASIQMAARELRYNWFNELLQNHDFEYVLTAHHADDNLETFLINLTRGTGLEGLKGIPEINNKIIRPLLSFNKLQIKEYAFKHNISWREDNSNSDTKYLRNQIRHELVPILNKINPNFMESFAHTLKYLKGSSQIVEDRIKNVQKDILIKDKELIKIDIQKLKILSNSKSYLHELLKNYGFTEWNDVFSLLDAQSGKQVHSKTHRLIKDREYLLLAELKKNEIDKMEISESCHKMKIDHFNLIFENIDASEKNFSDEINSKQIVLIDKDLLRFPLHVRKWKKGDYFYPLGMQGRKKLSKYFTDEKLSLIDKENIWLLCSENKIVWILNHRSDKRFSVSNSTKNILKVKTK
jgi:tRNA(Ile)-lysidine synthase